MWRADILAHAYALCRANGGAPGVDGENIYMHRFIKAFRTHGLDRRYGAVLVTYADDFVVLCRHDAAKVVETIRQRMARIGLALNDDKTRVCHTQRESFDFVGYTFGPLCSPNRRTLQRNSAVQAGRRLHPETHSSMTVARQSGAVGRDSS